MGQKTSVINLHWNITVELRYEEVPSSALFSIN